MARHAKEAAPLVEPAVDLKMRRRPSNIRTCSALRRLAGAPAMVAVSRLTPIAASSEAVSSFFTALAEEETPARWQTFQTAVHQASTAEGSSSLRRESRVRFEF